MIIGSLGLDQVSKHHAQTHLMTWSDAKDLAMYQGQRHPVWSAGEAQDGSTTFVSISTNYVRNLGAAWGALAGLPEAVRVPFFYLVTVVAVVIIGLYLRATPPSHRLAIFSLNLILSGAIGNFIDRVRLGYVIDFIDVRWNLAGWRYDFPNFNFADSCITVGVTLLMVDMLILEAVRRRRETTRSAAATPA
jgi:signal peptidase II